MRDPPRAAAPALGEGLRSQPPRWHPHCPPSMGQGAGRHPSPSFSSCPCRRGLGRASRAVYGPRGGVEQGSGRVNTAQLTQRRGCRVWGGCEGLGQAGLPDTSLARAGSAPWHLHAERPGPGHLLWGRPWSAWLCRRAPGAPVTSEAARAAPLGGDVCRASGRGMAVRPLQELCSADRDNQRCSKVKTEGFNHRLVS